MDKAIDTIRENAFDVIQLRGEPAEQRFNTSGEFVSVSIAQRAIRIASTELKDKAIKALSSVLENRVHGGDSDCIVAEFEEKLKNL